MVSSCVHDTEFILHFREDVMKYLIIIYLCLCPDAPSSPVIYPRDDVELEVKNTLICHVTGFYPAPVKFSWTKNGQSVTEGTSVNVPYINKDGTYNQFSKLDFIPQQGDFYSCSVSHPALKEPQTRIWGEKLYLH